jgi:WhiB family redox-sensing transcriptional regulator
MIDLTKAACKGEDTAVFFPSTWQGNTSSRKAKSICSKCAVTHQCLDYALKNEIQHGVWGGLNPYERAIKIGRPKKQIY